MDTGYPWCRTCRENHRPPECAVDEKGRALDLDGRPWDVTQRDPTEQS